MAEYLFNASLVRAHLSRLCEDTILYTSDEFGYWEIPDAYSTGSSIMPQKKNPDIPELVRGKTGRVYGHLMGVLTMLKGIPLAYDKDLQEDKEPFFDAQTTMESCLSIYTALVSKLTFNVNKMYDAAGEGYATATDVADYLAKRGRPLPRRTRRDGEDRALLHRASKDAPRAHARGVPRRQPRVRGRTSFRP